MFAVLIPVGPAPRELDRLRDTLESVQAFEDARQIHLVLVDDGVEPRDLGVAAALWGSLEVIRNRALGRSAGAYDSMVAGTVNGLKTVAARKPDFVLKLDTDALVIGRVLPSLQIALADARVGLVGSYTHTCTGDRRDWSGWIPVLRRAERALSLGPGRRLTYRRARSRHWVHHVLDAARDNGYELGAHCLGGAYAVGPGLLQRTDLLDFRPWLGTGLGEDVVVGALTFAAGLTVRGLTGRGEPFGLAWQGLPLPPAELIAHGHSVVHSVKDQALGDEQAIRAYFRSARAGSSRLPDARPA
ncbi:MAG: hypothetical protein ACRDNK_22720 [Solirubrobacteraceae bacterium]